MQAMPHLIHLYRPGPRSDVRRLPSPPSHPLWGHAQHFGEDSLPFLSDCARRFGRMVPLRLGHKRCLLLTQASDVAAMMRRPNDFAKGREAKLAALVVGEGMIQSNGQAWHRSRKRLKGLFAAESMAEHARLMQSKSAQTTAHLPMNTPVDAQKLAMQHTLSVLSESLLGLPSNSTLVSHVQRLVEASMEWWLANRSTGFLIPFALPLPRNRALRQIRTDLDRELMPLLRARRRMDSSDTHPRDALTMILETCNGRISDQALRGEFLNLMIAGYHTSALLLTWSMAHLARAPQLQAKMALEAQQLLAHMPQGRSDTSCTVSDVNRAPLLDRFVKEVMRLYPPAPLVFRATTRDVILEAMRIPKGWSILFSIRWLHHDPQFFASPYTFMPERWTGELEKKLPRGQYVPLGFGPRACIAGRFGTLSIKLFLAHLLAHTRLTLTDTQHSTAIREHVFLEPSQPI
ncbi:MAG: cytochrome P450, partial [Myxococcota bacterium]